MRLGILDFNPIQYHTPLYQLLAQRGRIEVDVLFISNYGLRPIVDAGFGVPVAWDIDLLSGYSSSFLTYHDNDKPKPTPKLTARLARWIKSTDAVVVHGYSNPWMLFAMAICRLNRIPYLLRGDSGPEGQAAGLQRHLRELVARGVVSASAGGLAIGQLNDKFYRKYGAPNVYFAPYSVDDQRFASKPSVGRADLLARWGVSGNRPVIMFCGKLYPGKRPLDLVHAVRRLPTEVTTIFVGDGVQAGSVRELLNPSTGVVTGFVNQAELPSYYHAADILVLPSGAEKWGLVVNEAMAAGALPVVSDRVGAAPDLVVGVGEVYPCGNIPSLTAALSRALSLIDDTGTRGRVRQQASRYSLRRTAEGFELAAMAVAGQAQPHSSFATANGA